MNITEWWDLQEPGSKRKIYIIGGAVGLVLLLMMMPGKEKREVSQAISEVEVDILGDDAGSADLQQVIAENKVQKGRMENMQRTLLQMNRRMQNLQNSLSAATSLNENPEQLGQLVDEFNRMKEDVQDMRENGQVRQGSSNTPPPVQLVLGGASSNGSTTDNTDNDELSNPFSDVSDGDVGPIAKYDPLARIKGAIDDSTTKNGGRDDTFSFMKDSNFERSAPKIVIDKYEDKKVPKERSGGSRPGQSARDARGENIAVAEEPTVYIPSGTLFEGVLLNGMDAPTSSGSAREPYPATIRLTSLAFLPNRYTTNVKECLVGAAGFGRLDSERVHLRTETLSCVLNDGSVIDVNLQGYITGEDGKVGLRGVVVERTGQLLMRAALAGVASGFSQALEPQRIQSVQTGQQAGGIQFDAPDTNKVLEVGAYKGASTAMEKLSDFYLERADQIFPIIEIDSLRKVTVHLTAGVSLKKREGTAYSQLSKNETGR